MLKKPTIEPRGTPGREVCRSEIVPGAIVILGHLLATIGFEQWIVATTVLEWDGDVHMLLWAMAALPGLGVVVYGSTMRYRPTLAQLYLTLAVLPLLLSAFMNLGHIAHYLGRGEALWDDRFAAFDKALGLDWVGMLAWANEHPWISNTGLTVYLSLTLQGVAVPVLVALARQHARVQEFFIAGVLGLIITHAIACLTPALGAYHFFGVSAADHPAIAVQVANLPVHDILGMRSGAIVDVTRPNEVGLIVFPSFHTTAALLFAWALWRVPYVRFVGLALNGAMIAATPLHGSHYFVDVVAGAAVAAASLWLARAVRHQAIKLRVQAGKSPAIELGPVGA